MSPSKPLTAARIRKLWLQALNRGSVGKAELRWISRADIRAFARAIEAEVCRRLAEEKGHNGG